MKSLSTHITESMNPKAPDRVIKIARAVGAKPVWDQNLKLWDVSTEDKQVSFLTVDLGFGDPGWQVFTYDGDELYTGDDDDKALKTINKK